MQEIFKENCSFMINECVIKINKQNITIENYNKENIDLYELMWIVYGFFPPIKHIEYIYNEKKITEYIDSVYNRVSNREHFLEINKLVNIEKIDNLYDFDESNEKNIIIDKLIQYLKELKAGKYESGLESALNSLRRKSLKSRIDTFIDEYDKYDIFKEEKILCSKWEKKANICPSFII